MEPAPVAIKLIEPEENDEWQPRKTAQAFQEQMRALQKATMARARGEQAGEQERQADFDDTRPPEEEAEQRSKVVSLKDWRVRYYHNDHLGTPRELSDEDGGIVWQATYKAWGNTLRVEATQPKILQNQERLAQATQALEAQNDPNAQQQEIEQNLRFQGQYYDQETGLHYNRFRYYDPDIGRFISQDPIGFAGSTNWYAYAPNPVGWIDILGLACGTGQVGERIARRWLEKQNHEILGAIQNTSGHGIDMVTRNKSTGLIEIFEVKTTAGSHSSLPSLSSAQQNGPNAYAHGPQGRLQRAINVWKCYRNPKQPQKAQDIMDEIMNKQGGNVKGTVVEISLGNPGATQGKITTRPW